MLRTILDALLGGTGIASAVTNGVKWTAILAAFPLGWEWYIHNADHPVVTLNVSQALLVCGIVFAMVQVAHSARGPSRNSD